MTKGYEQLSPYRRCCIALTIQIYNDYREIYKEMSDELLPEFSEIVTQMPDTEGGETHLNISPPPGYEWLISIILLGKKEATEIAKLCFKEGSESELVEGIKGLILP